MRISVRILAAMLCTLLTFGCSAPAMEAAPTPTPEPPDALTLAAQCEAAGNIELAINAYKTAYAEDPRKVDVLRTLISLCAAETEAGRVDHTDDLLTFYDDLDGMDQMTSDELLSFCKLYEQRGDTWSVCRLIERAERLSPAPEQHAILDRLVVDVSTMPEAAQSVVQPLYDTLAKADTDAAVALLWDGGVFASLRSTIRNGTRRYLAKGDGGQLKIEACYDAANAPLLRLWYLSDAGDAAVLRMESAALSVMKGKHADGAYNGAFTAEYYEGATGSIFFDAGTFTKNLLTGDYTSEDSFGKTETALQALFDTRTEVEKVLYEGTFDETGHTTEKQPSNVRRKGIVYAYQAKSSYKYVYVPDTEIEGNKEKTYLFDASDVGVDLLPVW